MRLLGYVGMVLLAGTLLLIVVLVVRRAYLRHQARVRGEIFGRLRPVAIAFVDADEPEPVPELHGREAEVFAQLLGGYARRLRGAAWGRIAGYFETTGGVDEQLGRLHSRRAWRRVTGGAAAARFPRVACARHRRRSATRWLPRR